MNWIDLVILAILIISFWRGFMQGIINILVELCGFILSFIVALKYYPVGIHFIQNYLNIPSSLDEPLGLVLVWLVVEVIYYLIVPSIVKLLPSQIKNSKINRTLGAVGSLVKTFIIIGFVLLLLELVPTSPRLKADLNASQLAPVIIKEVNILAKYIGSNLHYEQYLATVQSSPIRGNGVNSLLSKVIVP